MKPGRPATKFLLLQRSFFVFNMIALLSIDLVNAESLMRIAVLPVIVAGLGFLANKEPFAALLLTALIIFAFWIYVVVLLGPVAIMSGWLGKLVILYLLMAGLQNARETRRIRNKLKA